LFDGPRWTTMGFREYFNAQADVADELYRNDHTINCYITATAAIDALAEIWKSDFPAEAQALSRKFGGRVPSSIRMAGFVRKFAADPRAEKIAVICFAEDALRFKPTIAPSEVAALLRSRIQSKPGVLPRVDLDVDLAALTREAPTLLGNRKYVNSSRNTSTRHYRIHSIVARSSTRSAGQKGRMDGFAMQT
jgi:anti-sigma factor RsiW